MADPGSLAEDWLARAAQPAHRGERLLRLRPRIRRRRGSVAARRRGHQRPVPGRTPGPQTRTHRRDAVGHAERHRPPRHRRAPLHQREAAAPAPARRPHHREHLRHDARRIRRGRAHPLRRRGRGRARSEHLVPQHQGGRHPVRLQPRRHLQRGERDSQGDGAAGDSQAHAQRHHACVVRAGGRRRRRRRDLAREHLPGHGHRRGAATAQALERGGRAERPGDPSDCRADGLGVPAGSEDSHHRHGRHHGRARRARVHAGRRERGAGGHGQFRRPVHLDQAARLA